MCVCGCIQGFTMLLINDDKEKIKKGGGDKWCPEEGRQMLGLTWKTGTEKKTGKNRKIFLPIPYPNETWRNMTATFNKTR